MHTPGAKGRAGSGAWRPRRMRARPQRKVGKQWSARSQVEASRKLPAKRDRTEHASYGVVGLYTVGYDVISTVGF
eukprot:scaffold27670_cov112-Isochrysis_galbana.AAC.2